MSVLATKVQMISPAANRLARHFIDLKGVDLARPGADRDRFLGLVVISRYRPTRSDRRMRRSRNRHVAIEPTIVSHPGHRVMKVEGGTVGRRAAIQDHRISTPSGRANDVAARISNDAATGRRISDL